VVFPATNASLTPPLTSVRPEMFRVSTRRQELVRLRTSLVSQTHTRHLMPQNLTWKLVSKLLTKALISFWREWPMMVSSERTLSQELLNLFMSKYLTKRRTLSTAFHQSTSTLNKLNIFRLLHKDGHILWTNSWMSSNSLKLSNWKLLLTMLERDTSSQYQSPNTSPKSNTKPLRMRRKLPLNAPRSHPMFLPLLKSQFSLKTERKKFLLESLVFNQLSTTRLRESWHKEIIWFQERVWDLFLKLNSTTDSTLTDKLQSKSKNKLRQRMLMPSMPSKSVTHSTMVTFSSSRIPENNY